MIGRNSTSAIVAENSQEWTLNTQQRIGVKEFFSDRLHTLGESAILVKLLKFNGLTASRDSSVGRAED